MRLKSIVSVLLLLTTAASAKNLGTVGHTFVIAEENFLEVIQGRLKTLDQSGKIAAHNQEMQQRAKEHIETPAPITGIKTATEYRAFHYDPSFILDEDLKDHKGQIFARKGTTYNPLAVMPFGEPLLFIDGRDDGQVQWALQQQGKKVLVAGSPMQLAKDHQQHFYYDQGGGLVKKLQIQAVPARVSQVDKSLLIEIFPLKG